MSPNILNYCIAMGACDEVGAVHGVCEVYKRGKKNSKMWLANGWRPVRGCANE